MTTYTDITKDQFNALMSIDIPGKFQMLNLLKFKKQVEGSTLSGKEQYQEYLKAVFPFFQKTNARIIFDGQINLSIIGPAEIEWDKMLIVEYDSKKEFLEMITAKGYPAELRKAAMADSRLILCTSNSGI